MVNLTYEEAIKQVKAQVEASRTSFRAGMAILPKDRREAMYALYGFCRAVDDIADDSPSAEAAKEELQKWRSRIIGVFRKVPSNAITVALLPAISKFHLVEKDFHAIIDGMKMDSTAIIAPDSATLDLYCDRVASAVGRVSIRIFGASDEWGEKVAHHLGRALQLTNILRDLGEDAARGRLYLPRELLDKHSVTSRDPNLVLSAPELPRICRDLAMTARKHYAEADACMAKCSPETIRPARIMRDYYGAIFDRLVQNDWRNPSKRISLPCWKKLLLLFRGMRR